MNPSEARNVLRWIMTDPKGVKSLGVEVLERLGEAIPSILTTSGAYLLSDWLAKKFGLPLEAEALSPPMALPAPEAKSAGAVGEMIEPPSNLMSWKQREQAIRIKSARDAIRESMTRA